MGRLDVADKWRDEDGPQHHADPTIAEERAEWAAVFGRPAKRTHNASKPERTAELVAMRDAGTLTDHIDQLVRDWREEMQP